MFDPQQFASSNVAPLDTQIAICPEGEWKFVVGSDPKMLVPRNVKGESAKGAYDFWSLDITCECVDDNVKQQLGRDKVTVRYSVNLDLDGNGNLDAGKGKNVSLGQLREALGQNADPTWTPGKLLGAGPFVGKVTHTQNKGKTYANITRAAPLS